MGSQPGAATARASSTARTDSPASSSRFRSRTAPSTWVESVRCLPPAVTSPNSPSRASGTSRTCSCGPWATSRARNSDNTEASKPGSLSDIPSAYFHEIFSRTASAACRSVRFSAICNTVPSASRPGDQPGLPRAANAAPNSSSVNTSPS